jgi:hypothetical protein
MRWKLTWANASLLGVLLLGVSTAQASTINLSSVSSDATPASSLSATIDTQILGGDTLQLTVTNDTTAPNEFNINQVYFNGSDDVTSLVLSTATHSDVGDVLVDWAPVDHVSRAGGFGNFDFGLLGGVGENDPSVIGPTESIVYVLAITGTCANLLSCTMDDFNAGNANGFTFAAKFVNGPDDPEAPGTEDSAFGTVPEPATALLVPLGLGLACWRGRSRLS